MAQNKLLDHLQMAQSSGGSPYDESAYMQPGGNASPVNNFLNNRLMERTSPTMGGYMLQQMGPRRGMPPDVYGGPAGGPAGGDADLMAIYGPPDQVAFDQSGAPIPLADPRHPRNQRGGPAPSYPQQRR